MVPFHILQAMSEYRARHRTVDAKWKQSLSAFWNLVQSSPVSIAEGPLVEAMKFISPEELTDFDLDIALQNHAQDAHAARYPNGCPVQCNYCGERLKGGAHTPRLNPKGG